LDVTAKELLRRKVDQMTEEEAEELLSLVETDEDIEFPPPYGRRQSPH
jgi:hypothetical protein